MQQVNIEEWNTFWTFYVLNIFLTTISRMLNMQDFYNWH
jgi:hypothetical protein